MMVGVAAEKHHLMFAPVAHSEPENITPPGLSGIDIDRVQHHMGDLGRCLAERAGRHRFDGRGELNGSALGVCDLESITATWAIEGTGGYGAGLARHLTERGEVVIELARPNRPPRRQGAKSDPLDAVRAEVAALGVPEDLAEPFWLMARDNITTLGDLAGWWALCRDGAEPLIADEDREFIAQAMDLLPEGPFDGDTWGTWTKAVKEASGRKGKGLFMPLRKALTGQERGPEMAALLPLLQVVKARG